MDMQQDLVQPFIAIPLPLLAGSADFIKHEKLLMRIDQLLDVSNVERKFVEQAVASIEKADGKKLDPKSRIRAVRHASLSLRCNIARMLTQKDFRELAVQLADSYLLRRFCRLDGPHAPKKSPSKTTLQRMAAETDAATISALVQEMLNSASSTEGPVCQEFGLIEPIRLDVLLMDSTCLELNIHFPTDWVLLRDACRSMLETIMTIRRHGLTHRMPDPKTLLSRANKLAMKMSQAARRGKGGGGRKVRKQVLRELKKLTKNIQAHAQRYRDLLSTNREKTDLSEGQAKRFIRSLDNILEQLPAAIHQAHERIIGERKVSNDEKILSLYESHAKVYTRGKAGAEVEFGLQLQIGENMDGLIMDWELVEGSPRNDTQHIRPYIERMHARPVEMKPRFIVTDRGYSSQDNEKLLVEEGIESMLCPKDSALMAEKMGSSLFAEYQRRRAQTEARISILKHGFIGAKMPAKGFERQKQHVAWAILTHNLWVLARRPNRFDEISDETIGRQSA
jgi:Transposase DDE domain